MLRALLVGFGGFVGSMARYWLAGLVLPWTPPGFPWGTLLVNVSGSFLLGLVIAAAMEREWLGPDLRVALAAGVCGGFTTMSSFSFEMLALLEQGSGGLAFGYAAATMALCLVATWAGIALIRLM